MKQLLYISDRAKNAPFSPIRGLASPGQKAQELGKIVYHVNIGDPDFLVPEKIKQTALEVVDSLQRVPYPAFRGQAILLSSWKKYFSDIQISDIQDDDMIVTAGASDAMVLAAATVLNPEDEYLIFEPFYGPYIVYGSFVGAKAVSVPLDKENNYHLPAREAIVGKITPKTKAIFFTNPNNPTGTVFTEDEIQTIINIAQEHNLFLVSDETYRGMTFDNNESFSVLHVANTKQQQQIIVADSLSKRLNVCGARMGLFLSKNRDIVDSAFRFVQGRPFASYIEQEMVAPMLMDCLNYVDWLKNEYQKRRDVFINTFEKEMGIHMPKPEGAFYAMLQLPIDDDMKFAKWLLTDFDEQGETVMVSPGSGFYLTPGKGKNEIRIAYVLDSEKLEKVAKLLAMAVKKYQSLT